jgi:hypothetical protein
MDFRWAVQRLFREDLPAKVCVAKSYGKLWRRFGQREQVEAQPRSLPDPTGASRLFRPREREKLGPHDGLGPGYGADEARDAISRRFKNGGPSWWPAERYRRRGRREHARHCAAGRRSTRSSAGAFTAVALTDALSPRTSPYSLCGAGALREGK